MIQTDGVGTEQPAHSFHQVGLRGLDHQMKVVVHEAISMHLPTALLTGFGQGFEETVSVHVVEKYVFPSVPTTQDMINGPGIFHPQLAWHGRGLGN